MRARSRGRRSIEIAFWLALALSALPVVLVMPHAKYVLGFIALAALYGVVAVGQLTATDLRQLALRSGVLMRQAGEAIERSEALPRVDFARKSGIPRPTYPPDLRTLSS